MFYTEQRSAAWRILKRCLAFGIPFILMVFVESFILPIQAFSFRLWEPLSVPDGPIEWNGPFYPDLKISMREQGDLAHGSKLAIAKDVYWETDARGFRNRQNDQPEEADVVVVGDSMIVGTSLTQDFRLTDRITHELKKITYAYAPGQVPRFLADPAWSQARPRILVFESIERSLPDLRTSSKPYKRVEAANGQWLFLNRIFHPRYFAYFQAEWNRFRLGYPPQGVHTPGSPMVFYQGDKAAIAINPADIKGTVATIKHYQTLALARGMEFVFLPIPNKETVYYEYLPSRTQSLYLKDIIQEAQSQGIRTVDTFTAFQTARNAEPDRLLYHLDDTHWNAEGVDVVLKALASFL